MSISTRRAGLLSTALALSFGLAAAHADASPGCECGSAPRAAAGAYEHSATNARLLYPGFLVPPQPSLRALQSGAPTGELVALRIEPAGDVENHVWLVPEKELRPSTTYQLEPASPSQVPSTPPPPAFQFRTGQGPDKTPPAVDAVRIESRSMQGACPSQVVAYLLAQGARDDMSGVFLRVRLRGAGMERFFFLPPDGGFFGDADSEKGPNGCLTNAPGVGPRTNYEAIVTAIDSAGNESPPVEIRSFQFLRVAGRTCGCSLPGARSNAGLPALLLCASALVIAWRRKRHPGSRL